MHSLRIRSLALIVAGFSAAVPLRAQQPAAPAAPDTHVVKRGDTLWDLAKQYLGDAFLWPEIYRLNTDKIEDPHWIYPGETLKLPGAKGAVAATPVASEPAAAPVARRMQQPHGMTVFNPNANSVEQRTRQSLSLRKPADVVRPGEYRASPFVWSAGGPVDGGVLEEATELPDIEMTAANRPMQYLETMFVHLPKGMTGNVGEKYLVYRVDSLIEGQGQVIVPTGVVKIVTPGAQGRSRAQLVEKYEDVFQGQGITQLDSLRLPEGAAPARVEFGLATRVVWVGYNPVLPSGGAYLAFAAGQKEGLSPGDQVTLLRERGVDSRGMVLPDEEVAVAQVTRVTQWGAAGIILRTREAGVEAGMRARVTAKMP